MKYSHLVHMPRDVKHWLEQQLEAHGIDEVVYTKYLITLLQDKTLDNFLDFMPPALDSKTKYYIKNLVDELCTKLQETEHRDSSRLECKADTLAMDPNHGFSYKLNNSMNCMEPIQPCLPPNSAWTRGLLHDSASELKMDDYFSKLFYDNPADLLGYEFAWNKSDERKNGHETDRINFYNKQNLLASECSERLYERNADIDKLIAKFDANIEDIWKTTSESDHVKYHTLFSQNFFPNPYLHYGSNVIWAFEENKPERKVAGAEKGGTPNHKSSFSHWSKFSSPVLTNNSAGFDTMLSAFNMTLSNAAKWSDFNNAQPGKTGSCFVESKAKVPDETAGNPTEIIQNSQEEEDLLTSAKTHFRPIRMEELGGSHTGTYADGTTFAISNDLEKVSFKRSESGTLYLEADADTPRKYMEYKEKDAGNKGDWESDNSSVEEFVPKFRVRQNNEKCCQTDEIDEEQIVPSINETDCDSVSYESEEDEFYFPGDEELAQNIINAIEEEAATENGKINSEYNDKMEILELSMYKMPETKECICKSGKDWEEGNKKQEWSEIWNSQATCDNCNSEKLSSKDKFRFREELTQEGEQLLMDLSCLQQMYSNSEWCDDDSTTASELNDEEAQVEEAFDLGDVAKGAWWSLLIAKDEPAKKSFDLRSLWKEENLLSDMLEDENKNKLNEINERPLIADMIQTERKRRNSSSQKACNLYLEGQCRRPHCRFAHYDSAIPCPFFADASCMKGESCPMSHGARRPLSLCSIEPPKDPEGINKTVEGNEKSQKGCTTCRRKGPEMGLSRCMHHPWSKSLTL